MERMGQKGSALWKIQIVSSLLILVSVVVMFMTHREIPFMMDDLWYSTLLYDDTPISSLGDVLHAQIWHYNNWGGRAMTHTILQLLLLSGELAADILNVLFTLLLSEIICLISENNRPSAFFAASAMILGLNANWKMSMFWQAGAANYLYITVFILLFGYCYLRELPDEKDSSGVGADSVRGLKGIALWIIPLGVLAGWSNENMGPAIWLLSVAVIALLFREKRRVRLWMVSGSISCLFGSIMCIVAPGNAVRRAQIEAESYGTLWRLFLRGYEESKAALEYLFPTILILGGMVFISKFVLRQPLGRRNLLMLSCALLSWGAFVLSPHYPDRATFGTMVLCICVILSLAKKILQERKELAVPLFAGVFFVWLRGMYFCGEYLGVCWGWIV